jgi:hypothetical protein
MGRFILVVGTAVLAVWLVGALAQGLLFQLSLVGHKVWLFNFWFEKFGLGLWPASCSGSSRASRSSAGDRPARSRRCGPQHDTFRVARCGQATGAWAQSF